MSQVCVSVLSVTTDVREQSGKLNAFNALLGARNSQGFWIREQALVKLRYMLLKIQGMRYDGSAGCSKFRFRLALFS
jgi:hypothetical protein